MAQTKTRSSGGRAKARSTNGRAKSAKAKAKPAKRQRATSANGSGKAGTARKAVEGTAKQAAHSVAETGHDVGKAIRKARTPLLASGAAVAGAAGGLALGARQARHSRRQGLMSRSRAKLRSHDVAKTARDVGELGVQVGQLASELRRNREAADGARRRSPIEVVLQGLTARSGSS